MKITLRQTYFSLFLIGVFFMPFNSWEGISFLGEFKRESSVIFFLLGFVFVLVEIINTKKICIPKSGVLTILILFLLWCVLTILFNFPTVLDSYYKKTSGVNRFIRQFVSLLISCVIFLYFYYYSIKDIELKEILQKIRKVLFFSLIVVCVYGFFEIIYLYSGFYPAYQVMRLFDYFPFTEFDIQLNGRISSVTWESPALATYLITIAGWMFSYIITNKSLYKYIPTLSILVLTYYSGSRTALIVILVQLLVFLFIYLNKKQLIKLFLLFSITALFAAVTIFLSKPERMLYDIEKKIESLDFKDNLKTNISNQSRFGIQYANLMVFKEYPITGAGFGQQGFHAVNYYPIWAKKDNWEFKYMYLNKNDPSFAPGYNLYIRLLAETGIIGAFIFLLFIYYLIKKTYWFSKSSKKETKVLGIILLVSFSGYVLNFMQLDTFRIFGFWICLAIFVKISNTESISNTKYLK